METVFGKLDRTEKALTLYGHFILNYNQRCQLEPHKKIKKLFERTCTNETKFLKRNKSHYDFLPIKKRNILDKTVDILDEANLTDIPGYVYLLFQRYKLPFLSMLLTETQVDYYLNHKDEAIEDLDKLFTNDSVSFLSHVKYYKEVDNNVIDECCGEITPLFLRFIIESFKLKNNDSINKKSIGQYLLWPYGYQKAKYWSEIVKSFFGENYASHYIRFD